MRTRSSLPQPPPCPIVSLQRRLNGRCHCALWVWGHLTKRNKCVLLPASKVEWWDRVWEDCVSLSWPHQIIGLPSKTLKVFCLKSLMIHYKLFSSFRSTDTIFHLALFISFINFVTCSYFFSKLLPPKLLFFIFSDHAHTLSIFSAYSLSPQWGPDRWRMTICWLLHSSHPLYSGPRIPGSRFLFKCCHYPDGWRSGWPPATPVYLSTLVEHSEYISILYFMHGGFLP